MSSIVDIHPHVISPDTQRYPLNPLGGTQSTWSRDRPTPFEALVAGCGTGRQSVELAQRHPAARILAIDLSLTSLSYALRKTRAETVCNAFTY